jgi:hypothetical protein
MSPFAEIVKLGSTAVAVLYEADRTEEVPLTVTDVA